jgi:hypothetical protein
MLCFHVFDLNFVQNMSAASNDSPPAHDMSPSQRPPLVPESEPWGKAPHESTYTWLSWPHVLSRIGVPPTGSPVYTWPHDVGY